MLGQVRQKQVRLLFFGQLNARKGHIWTKLCQVDIKLGNMTHFGVVFKLCFFFQQPRIL